MTEGDILGTFPDRHTIRFEIFYPHPVSRVWDAITDPRSLSVWFMPLDMEQRVGGRVVLRYSSQDELVPAEGVVTSFESESVLEYRFAKGPWRWPESTLRFDLAPDGHGCRLVFSQEVAPDTVWDPDPDGQIGGPGTVHPGACSGWEGFFREGLSRFLDGRSAPIYDDSDDALMDARAQSYRARIRDELGSG